MKPRPERKTYDASEAAALLGVSVDVIYREVHAGRLPGAQLGPKGSRVVVLKEPLDRMLQADAD